MKIHELKTIQPFFNQVKTGKKRFELRKNDRDFMVNDILRLREWDNAKQLYMGNDIIVRVLCVLDQFIGIQQGYCILSISDPL